ncbi:MAG: glutaredoxin family protein [Fidelibacterota bacterium]
MHNQIPVVEIYTKANCHLCREAKRSLLKIKKLIDFKLREVNITSDPHLYELYKERIPLIFINGKLAAKYRVDEGRFMKKLRSAV